MRTILLILLLLLAACGEPEGIIVCEPAADLEPICGFQNPEDLARLPDSPALLVSQFGKMDGSLPGNLARFDTQNAELQVLFRGGDAQAMTPTAGWGEADCPGPPGPAFAPHGIHLTRRRNGPLQLLVVNHGGRESIEFFEVTSGGERLSWRGCALPPEDAYINSVVATPEGGFLATHMFPRSQALGALKGMLGSDTGYVLEWTPDGSWTVVPGSEAPFPNGIELSPDGKTIYLNAYMADEVRKIDRETGELRAIASVAKPDNTRWSADGSRLFVASHTGSLIDMLRCQGIEQGACTLAFEIVALDPKTLERETVLAHEGPPMGAATVALDVDGVLYIGSFKGDRLALLSLR
jgi:sugar lactone lactonase YvrE